MGIKLKMLFNHMKSIFIYPMHAFVQSLSTSQQLQQTFRLGKYEMIAMAKIDEWNKASC